MPGSNAIDLDTPYPLSPEQIRHFRERGYVKLKNVLSPATISHYGQAITAEVKRLNKMHKPMSERTTYQRAFLQVMNIWRESEVVREFSFSKRLARIAAELMGITGVRMYHDQALYKEPGGGFTPWHADQYYWPFATDRCVTVWIPLQETPMEMGPLSFAAGSHTFEHGRDLPISDESERVLQEALAEQEFAEISEPFELGEVSYHLGWTFHHAPPNTTDVPRRVMTIIYMDADMRIAAPANKNQEIDLAHWMPGAQPGDPVTSPLNPILY